MNHTPPAELNDAASRYKIESSSNALIRRYSKNVSGACRPSLAQRVYEIRSTKLLPLRKLPTTNKDAWRVRYALQKHLEIFPAREIQFSHSLQHVASKLSEIVRNFRYFINRTKIASCVDVAAYSDA